jgi:hypothetical protein
MQLKTINEMCFPSDGCDCLNIMVKEAINWIKHYRMVINGWNETITDSEGTQGPSTREVATIEGKIDLLKIFFNITEDDLQ